MEYAQVAVPAAAIRRKPRHQGEMSNQLLFGEAVKVLKEKGPLWVKVRSLHDDYEGWMTRNLLQELREDEANTPANIVTSGFLNPVTIGEETMNVPMASSLPGFEMANGKIGALDYNFHGNYFNRLEQVPSGELLELLARQWLNAPYLWGGRTILGVDCSGFVQTNFKLMGMNIARDAWQQAQQGVAVKKLKDAIKGDLAFFDDKEEIVHVGILLDNATIIHASGKVRIDDIDKKGITNRSTGKRTHNLRAIRRFF